MVSRVEALALALVLTALLVIGLLVWGPRDQDGRDGPPLPPVSAPRS